MARRLGCARGHGYLYSRPIPADELEPLLERGMVTVPGRSPRRVAVEPIPIRRSRGVA